MVIITVITTINYVIRYLPHIPSSNLSLILPSLIVCHCILIGLSGPPHANGTMWSITYPGHAPLVFPFDGHGCSRLNAFLADVLRCYAPNATWYDTANNAITNTIQVTTTINLAMLTIPLYQNFEVLLNKGLSPPPQQPTTPAPSFLRLSLG